MRLTLATKSFSSRALLILLFASWSNSISVSLSPEEAKQFLSRPRRAFWVFEVFEETKRGHLERECVEERCSKEEAREVFENDPETEYFYPKYLTCVEKFGDSEKKRQDLVTCVHNIPDQCSPSPCNPRGTVRCEDKKGDFFCHCFTGWIGARCKKFTMMQGAVRVWNLSAPVCLGTGHHHAGHEGHEDNSADHAAKSLSMVRSANKGFTFNLYRQLAAQTDNQGKNVFFSPASVSLALAALSVGARGQTHQQLFSGLGFNSSLLSQVDVNQAFHGILTGASKTLSEDISAGTAVFVDNKFKPRPEFLEALRQSYLAEGFTVDFNNSTESAATINKYVEGKTHGKIDQLVENLDPDTIMYLISYIYYKGKWLTPFDPANTEKDLFNVDAQNQVPVQMMNTGLDRFDVYHDQQISTTVLRLPFNNSYSMLLMLPDGELTALEEHICPMRYTKWLNGMKKGNYDVFVPKFSIKTKVNLNNVLRQMGITDMFGSAANLSGIAEGVAVSEVVHEATLDVDEAGATASAATGIAITSRSSAPDPELKFNRPFMVLIADSDNILFMGKIVNPNI